jgi:hypothetical protein
MTSEHSQEPFPLTPGQLAATTDIAFLYDLASRCPCEAEPDSDCLYCAAYVRALALEDAQSALPDQPDVFASIEARAHEMQQDSHLESSLSVNDFVNRVRGAATEARMYARTGQAGLEERSWIEMAAIAARRVQQIRELTRA